MRPASLTLFLLLSACSLAPGQQSAGPQSASQQALSWLSSEWTAVKKEGRSAADRAVREYPQRFKALKAQVARMTLVAGQIVDTNRLAEKKELLMELWEVRGSLNILALCSPDVIHQLTGLDTAAVVSLENQVASLRKRLGG